MLHLRNTTRLLFLSALAAAVLAPACVTETVKPSPLAWRDGASTGRESEPGSASRVEPPPREDRRRESDEIVTIPSEVMAELMASVNRLQGIVAERIEVDASRIPFQMALVPIAHPDSVETVEVAAPELKATGIVMRALAEVPLVETDYCRLRVGDGMDLVAGREIVVRTYNEVDPRRPAFLVIRATGHAVHRDGESGARREGERITMALEIVRRDGRLVFRSSLE